MYTVFYDDFNGNAIDRNSWDVNSHYKRSLGFLVDNPLNINVVNSKLELKMRYVPNYLDSIWKTTGWQHVYSDYTGAEISTKQPFRYGSFECSAKFAHEKGSWPAFWIIGGDGTPCPPGGYGNEIDIAEFKCDDSDNTLDHVIHRYYPPTNCDNSNHQEKDFYAYRGMSFDDNYHLFKCVWSPDNINYYVDNMLTHQVINTGQEWYPSLYLSVILSQQVIDPIGAIIAPQTSYFDYVRVKQFFLAPEITVPSYICSTATATLDVAPLASNITWQLTPSSLFATSSGTGKTVNIVKAPIESGMGKITYTFQMPGGETFTAEKSFRMGLTGSFTGNTSVAYKGTGTWNAVASCGTSPYTFEWWLREEGTGVGAQLVATGSQLTLLSVPRTTMAANLQDVKSDPIINGPVTNTYYDLYLRVVDGNGVKYIEYTTPEQRIIASGNVDLVPRSLNRMTDGLSEPANGILLNAFPNPTGSETTIELTGAKMDSLDVSTTWDMDVYDPSSMLKTKADKIQGKTYKINTSDWKEGVYVLRAKVNSEIITEKLYVKH